MHARIFRLVTKEELAEAQVSGQVPRSPADEKSGFIHLSPREEVLRTANRYFSVDAPPALLEIDTTQLEANLKWEVVASRGHVKFPHLYAANIPWSSVSCVHTLSVDEHQQFRWDMPQIRSNRQDTSSDH